MQDRDSPPFGLGFSGAYSIYALGPEAVDVAANRVRGALALATTVEPLDAAVEDSAIRPAMDLDDILAAGFAREQRADRDLPN